MEAQLRYEGLSEKSFLNSKHVIKLEDYSQMIRAQILYNHLFFSNLPDILKTALVPERQYLDVIRHPNYNPRVIEHAVSLPGIASLSQEEFVSNIFATLDDPTEVWQVIFRNLPDMARRILITISSLPTRVFLSDLQQAVENSSSLDFDAESFRDALSMVEGTFVDLMEADPGSKSRQRIVTIRDPSVRDYLWGRLDTVEGEADALLKSAVFFEQCVILYEGRNHAVSMSLMFPLSSRSQTRHRDVVNSEAVAIKAFELLSSDSPMVSSLRKGGTEYFERQAASLERRTAFLLAVLAGDPNSRVVEELATRAIIDTVRFWENGQASLSEALQLVKQMKTLEGLVAKDSLENAGATLLRLITRQSLDIQDFERLVDLAALCPHLFLEPHPTLESWSSEFEDFLDSQRDWLLEQNDDPDWVEEEMRTISKVASAMDIDISELEFEVEGWVEHLRTEQEPDIEDDIPRLNSELEESSHDEADIIALFQSLS